MSNRDRFPFFTEYMEQLLDRSQRQFHEIFKDTYGVLYEKNSLVFREYFSDLKHYFYHGQGDLVQATDRFFTSLYQKMFQVKVLLVFY